MISILPDIVLERWPNNTLTDKNARTYQLRLAIPLRSIAANRLGLWTEQKRVVEFGS